jgi:hypothetical protein
MQPVGGAPHMLEIGDRLEVAQVSQVHRKSPVYGFQEIID